MGWARAGLLFFLLILTLYPMQGRGQGGVSSVEWVASDGGGVETGGHVTVKGLPPNMIFDETYTVAFNFVVEWFDWGSNIRPQSIEWYAKAGCLEETSGVCVRNSQNITLGSSIVQGSFSKNQTFSVTASLSLKDQPSVKGTVAALGVRIAAVVECLDSSLCAPVGASNQAQKFTLVRPESAVSFTIFSTTSLNVIRNPGFENGVDPVSGLPVEWGNWTKHGPSDSSISVDPTSMFSGNYSAKLDIGQIPIGFIALIQTLPQNTFFGNLTDRADGIDVWFKLEPKFSGMGDFRIRILHGENVGELNYVFDPDPILYYPNASGTDEFGRSAGVKSILLRTADLPNQGSWFHFQRNLKADWQAPLILQSGESAPGFSLDIPFLRTQFDALAFQGPGTGEYFGESVWVDDVKIYGNTGTPAPVPDFAISASPDSLKIPPGSSSRSTITVRSVNGFSGPVYLTTDVLSGYLPNPGITTSLGQPVLILTSGGSNTTILNVFVGNSTLPDTFSISVSGNALHSALVIVEVAGASEVLQRGPWSLEWLLSDNDGIIIRNVSYSGLSVLADGRLPGILSTYSNNYCGPFYEEAQGARIDPSQILVEDLATGGFQIRAPYYVPGEVFEQIWRFKPDGSFQGLLVIGNGGCSPAHAYEARWRYGFSLEGTSTILSYDGAVWRRVEQESLLPDSGSRDTSHNNTAWAVTGGGTSLFFAPSDDTAPDIPGRILAVVDRAGEIERNHSNNETPSVFLSNETLVGANAALWYVSKHSVDSLDVRPSNLAILTGLTFYIRSPSDLSPVASFTVSPNCAGPGSTLTFDATSSFDPDGEIASYHWDFGDGQSAEGPMVTHSYASFGSFAVKLTVQDNSTPPKVSEKQQGVVAGNCVLEADFTTAPDFIAPFTPVTFNATATGGTPPYTFSWDFGDGISGAGNPVVHEYAKPCGGIFNVSLIVTDSNGVFIKVTKTVTVVAVGQICVDVTSLPASPSQGEPVTFFVTVVGGVVPYTFRWDFGDGSTATTMNSTTTHAFSAGGEYLVFLTVIDSAGNAGAAFHQVVVQGGNIPPVASFIFSPFTPHTGEVVSFDGSSSYDPDGNITSWEWNFGDIFCIPGPCPGQPSGPIVQHTYSGPANYTVTLTVTDNLWARTATSQIIHVLPPFDHDVSVETIRVNPRTPVQGQQVGILLGLGNRGVENETVRLVVLWDSSTITDRTIVLRPLFNDPFGGILVVQWDTSNVPPGNHTISATVYLDTDQNTSNNSLTDGTVTILPPPTITLTPSNGTLGTKVVVTGTGFAIPEYGPPLQIFMSFDEQFLGLASPRNGNFSFTFDVPHSEPGMHQIKAFDTYSLVKATAEFQVMETPPAPELSVLVKTGTVYFPGDTATIYVHATVNGAPVSSDGFTLQLLLYEPDGTTVVLNTTLVEPGQYRAYFQIPSASVGTYAVVARASQLGAQSSSALASFEVKPSWLSQQGPRIAGATAAIAGIAAVTVAWRKGYFRRKGNEESDVPV